MRSTGITRRLKNNRTDAQVSAKHFFQGIINIPLAEGVSNNRHRITLKPDYHGSDVADAKKWNKTRSSVWPAVTEYTTLASVSNRSLVEFKPVTGFRHQIRAHVGLGLGTPILGDHKYSYAQELGRPQVSLFASRQSMSKFLTVSLVIYLWWS